MMGTEIFNFDASLAEKLTKTRVSFLAAPTVVTLHTSPYLHLPHQAHITPLVKCIETSGWWWWVVGGNQL